MSPLLAFSVSHYFFTVPLIAVSLVLILVVLAQRGRGGGVIGALGGRGGHSVFSPRAGDMFTWITFVVAVIWMTLAMAAIRWLAI